MAKPVAFAIFAHPDDIEFVAGGTLMKLAQAGWETHYMNLAAGDGGSLVFNPQQIAEIRGHEAKTAAGILGAKFHPSLCKDLQVMYDVETIRRLTPIIREVKPQIILTHSPEDYMEDHMNTSRLAVTAAFARGIPNFGTQPPTIAAQHDVTIYHAMPHGLRDQLRRRIVPGAFVDTTGVHDTKRDALLAHATQKDWLDQTQGMSSYANSMDAMSQEVGRMSGAFQHAEGWRRHTNFGFSPNEVDPLKDALGSAYLVNQAYEDAIALGVAPTL